MKSGKNSSVWGFFALVFALSAPFWLAGSRRLPLPVKLPASALMFVNPLIAAAILTHREQGSKGVKNLLKRTFDARNIQNKVWYLPILLLNPLIMVLSYGVMLWTGRPLPADPYVPVHLAPAYFAMFFVTGTGEELGWQGYAYDRIRTRWGFLATSLGLGLAWALIHVIPDVQNGQSAGWIFWHRLGTIFTRVLIGWLYEHTGRSVFGSILFHAMNNVSWALFPNDGSHYDPMVTTMITGLAAGAAVIGWRPKTPPAGLDAART